MKRLMKFETFVPKRVATRDAEAKAKNILVVNPLEQYQMADGKSYSLTMQYSGSYTMDYLGYYWQCKFAAGRKHIRFDVIVADDLDIVDIEDIEYNAADVSFASIAELELLAIRIAKTVVVDLKDHVQLSKQLSMEQLSKMVDELVIIVKEQLIKLIPAA